MGELYRVRSGEWRESAKSPPTLRKTQYSSKANRQLPGKAVLHTISALTGTILHNRPVLAVSNAAAPMSDTSKRLEKAEKYLQKGRQADALVEYMEALREDPN